VVQANSAPATGALNVGRYPRGTDDVTRELAAAFVSATFLSEPDDAVMAQKYAKLLMNLGNAVEALCGTVDRDSELLRRTRREATAVLEVAGIEVAPKGHDAEQRSHISIRPIGGERRGGGSTWQSFARGSSSVETDHLNGEIVLLGRLHDVPTPANALLQRLAAEFARQGRPPGSITEAELAALLPP
ncbi:MAG: ketopantoate reductase family protein, partial [Actinomycetota bacterium]|nr:ketopantoate reductase family protein [Actinomycetota bacterium]